jgi:alpha-1,2-mannosyltransferase
MSGLYASDESTFRWVRLAAIGFATLFVLCGIAAVILAYRRSILCDFLSFWAAGRLAIEGDASSAYDLVRHRAVEEQVVANVGFLPFPYPPSFLLVVAPFGILRFWAALGAWLFITAGLYIASVRRSDGGLRFALAQAAAAANFSTGQNGFLTSAIFIGGTKLLAARPLAAGAILGLLSFKPQLSILLPVALLAGREWRAIAGALLSSLVLLALSLVLFGAGVFRGFFQILSHYSEWLSAGRWPWGELASLYADLRLFGVPPTAAFAIHGVVALAAAALTARAWALRLEERIPILAAATLLVPPYLFTYDGLLLTLPLAWLIRREHARTTLAVWLLSVSPVICYFTRFPNTIPIAAMLALWVLHRSGGAAVPRTAGAELHQV